MGSVGAVLQGLLVPWMSETYGWSSLFSVFVGLAILAALCLVPTLRRKNAVTA